MIPCDKCGGPHAVIDDIVEGNLCADCLPIVDETDGACPTCDGRTHPHGGPECPACGST